MRKFELMITSELSVSHNGDDFQRVMVRLSTGDVLYLNGFTTLAPAIEENKVFRIISYLPDGGVKDIIDGEGMQDFEDKDKFLFCPEEYYG